MKIKLSTLLEKLNPLFNQCFDKLPLVVEVNYFEDGDKKNILSNALNKLYNINTSDHKDVSKSQWFEISFYYQGELSNLVISHIFNLDISAIKSHLLVLGKSPDLLEINNLIGLIKLEYENILPLLETFNGNKTNHDEIAEMLVRKNSAWDKNFGWH